MGIASLRPSYGLAVNLCCFWANVGVVSVKSGTIGVG
jgi:hypothetical protein